MAEEDTIDPSGESEQAEETVSGNLGQEDIDSLLQEVSGDEPNSDSPDGRKTPRQRIILSDGRCVEDPSSIEVEAYDFRNPAFIGELEMRRLRLLHEDFIRFLEARFALFLRMDFSLSMSQLTTVSYQQVIEEVENPSHLVLFRANPMPGMGFLEINPGLALTVASSILGGKGQAPRLERYLTKIEIDLIEEFLMILLQEWCAQWKIDEPLEPAIAGHEVVANVMQICEPETVMLSLVMEGQVRGRTGRIGIYVPLYMIESSIRHIQQQRRQDNLMARNKTGPAWHKGYENVPVTGKSVIPIGQTTVRELMANWKPGTVITLPDEAMQSVVLSLADIPLFRCEVGVEDDNIALNILEKKHKRGPLWNMKK